MALTTAQLVAAVRLEDTVSNQARVGRYQAMVRAYLDQVVDDLPDDVADVAVEMGVAWLVDRPQASSGRQSYSDVFALSGINAVITSWRVSRVFPAKTVNEVES